MYSTDTYKQNRQARRRRKVYLWCEASTRTGLRDDLPTSGAEASMCTGLSDDLLTCEAEASMCTGLKDDILTSGAVASMCTGLAGNSGDTGEGRSLGRNGLPAKGAVPRRLGMWIFPA